MNTFSRSKVGIKKQAANDIITILSAPPSTTEIPLEAGNPTINALLKIADTIKRLKPLPPQLPLTYTVAIPRAKEVLTGSTLLRVEGKITPTRILISHQHFPHNSLPRQSRIDTQQQQPT